MIKTKRKTIVKLGSLEISRKLRLAAEEKKPPKKVIKKGQGVVIGVTGNTGYWGYAETGEYLRKLEGARGRQIFDEMRRSDPQVQSVLKAITLPIRKAEYYVEPSSDDSKDVEIAETIENGLLKEMSITWDDTIRHALLMLPFGFSILEKVWEVRNGLIMPRKLDPRLPQSVIRWQYDQNKRHLIGPVQMDTDGREITLPIEKILIFTSEKEGDNWEGISILRAAYKPWYIKNDLEKINAIKHDRHGVGIPVAKVPSGVQEGSKEWEDTESALQDLYANERGYIVEPEGYEFRIIGGGEKSGTDALPSIKYYDEMIAKATLAMFINLGTSQTGSRALGNSFIELFMDSVQAYVDYIAEVISRFLIREWVDYNWSVKEYPVLKAARIKQLDYEVLAALKKAGVITDDIELENKVRESLHLPEKKEEEIINQPEEKRSQEITAHEHNHKFGWKLAERDLTEEEKLSDISSIELRLNEAQKTLEEKILELKEKQAKDIIMQIVGGRKIQNIRVILKKEMYEMLLREYKHQMKVGKKEAEQEIKNQIGEQRSKRFSDDLFEYDDYLKLIMEALSIDVEGASSKLKSLLASMAIEFKRLGLKGDDLKQALEEKAKNKISDKTWKDMVAGIIHQAWGAGRDLGIRKYQEEIDYCYYSAILDGKACPVCRSRDGAKHEYGDGRYITPNPECEGGIKSCRCMTIAVMKKESLPEEEYNAVAG